MEDLNVVSEPRSKMMSVTLMFCDWLNVQLTLNEKIAATKWALKKWEKDDPDDPDVAFIVKRYNDRIAALSRAVDEIKKLTYPAARHNSEAGASGSAQTT